MKQSIFFANLFVLYLFTNINISYPQKIYDIIKVDSVFEENKASNFFWIENDTEKSLYDYKDKIIIINFWASWTVYCEDNLKVLSDLEIKYKNKLIVIFINIFDEQNIKYLEYYLKELIHNNNVIQLRGNFDIIKNYGNPINKKIEAVPTLFLIKNCIIYEYIVGKRTKEEYISILNYYF